MNARFLGLVFGPLLAAGLSAQSLPTTLAFDETQPVTSSRVVDLGDVDGDGCDDFGLLAIAPNPSSPSSSLVRRAVISGKTGLPIHDFGPWAGWGGNVEDFIRLADLDGDGRSEFVTTAPPIHLSHIVFFEVRSGATGLSLGSDYFLPSAYPTLLAEVGDVTGDGVPDLGLATTPSLQFSPWLTVPVSFVDILDGATYTRSTLVSFANAELPPGGLVGVGDIDGDGFGDLATSSSATSIIAPGAGTATIFSGQTGAPLHTWYGLAGDGLGARLLGVDDVDADGFRDLAIFSPGSDLAGLDAGRVEIFSSALGARLVDILPATGEAITDLIAAGDHDGDGFRDLLLEITIPATSMIRRELRSGVTGLVITTVAATEEPVGDLNGDGIDELLDHASGQPTAGQTHYSARTLLGAESYGAAPSSPTLSWRAGTTIPAQGSLRLSGADPLTATLAAVSLAPADSVIFGTTLPLFVSVAPSHLIAVYNDVTDASGSRSVAVNLVQPALAGISLHVQYAILGPVPVTSNAVRLLFGAN
ncbi:MAG: hypothetical protein R3F20_15735 [Planctomycetota bacterium]